MWKRGYLGSENMGGAFSALRSSDLIYAGMVDRYLMGKQAKPNDLMSWNADGYVTKSSDLTELKKTINNLLTKKSTDL